MRRFFSYGPVDPEEHFCVERRGFIERCANQLVGNPEKGGHYFTIWAPRQSGKSWLKERTVAEVEKRYGDRFIVGTMSMQKVAMEENEPADTFLERVPLLFKRGFQREVLRPTSWPDWAELFAVDSGVFDRPVLLLIDEFDDLPRDVIDRLVRLFRDMYLDRKNYVLHGLALIGVRAVLGAESKRGSPFNVQRSLKIDNLTKVEVSEMFEQYQEESGQVVDAAVRSAVFETTRGQPGLVSWFGELLTEKYNPGETQPIDLDAWEDVLVSAIEVESNNNVLNLIAKAREHAAQTSALFSEADIRFSWDEEWCNFLYLHGVIDYEIRRVVQRQRHHFCRFASPFIQQRLYNAFTGDLYGDRGPILALEPGDLLDDVFTPDSLNLPALLERYKAYLARLKEANINPWEGHPRRKTDLNLPEAIGHFHLYAWLREAIGHRCLISPEFPTGNGKVDLVVRHEEHLGVIEVKSFRDSYELRKSYEKTAQYARGLGLNSATLVVFMPVHDEVFLEQTSREQVEGGVRVVTVAIGWG